MFSNLKLETKFVLSLLLISIVPLAAISTFNYYYSKSQLEKSTIGSLSAINDSRAAHINHLIQLRQEQAKEIAGSYITRQLQSGGFNHPLIVEKIQEQIDSIFSELKVDPTSPYKNIDQSSDIEIINVWDIHGNIIASTNRELVGKKMSFDFLRILYNQGAYFGGFEKDPFTNENYLTILEEARNWTSGDYAGVVFLKTSAKILNDITTLRDGLHKTGETYIIDKEKRMITESRFINNAVLRQKVVTKGSIACFDNQVGPRIYGNYRGTKVLGVHRYLPDQEWCILTEIALAEAFNPIIAFRTQMMIVTTLLIGLIFIFVHVARSVFVVPILKLKNASLEIAKGNYKIAVQVQSADEIGELTKTFNEMAGDLNLATSRLKDQNKLLEEQKEELKKFDKLKSEFVSMVSHELRTPMTIIKESISQLLEAVAEESLEVKKKLLTMALNNVNRLANLINNLLDLSKIEAGKMELRREPTDIVHLAKEVCFGFESQASSKKLALKQNFSKEDISINIDREKIIQVFINLMSNALKFVEKGHIEVSITEDNHHVVCSVADTGKGIAKEDLPKVFGKFEQFGRKEVAGVKGTGLGLSISKGLVELHGGEIKVESELGQGTKFTFALPKEHVKEN